jgi:hypothetical protein
MLQAREHAPTLCPSAIFTFGLALESIKEFGGVSKMMWSFFGNGHGKRSHDGAWVVIKHFIQHSNN